MDSIARLRKSIASRAGKTAAGLLSLGTGLYIMGAQPCIAYSGEPSFVQEGNPYTEVCYELPETRALEKIEGKHNIAAVSLEGNQSDEREPERSMNDYEKSWFSPSVKDIGLYIRFGEEMPSYSGLDSDGHDYRTIGVLAKAKLLGSDEWGLDLEAKLNNHESDQEDNGKSCTTIGGGFSAYKNFPGMSELLIPVAGVFVDLSYLTPRHNQKSWGDSGVIAGFGGFGGVRADFDSFILELLFKVGHWSDPLQNCDFGRNEHYIEFGFRIPLE